MAKEQNNEPTVQQDDKEITIDLQEIFYLLLQHWVGILITLIIGGLCAGVFTYFLIPPKYQATSRLYIVSASNDSVVDLSDLQIGSSLTADYEELMLSRPVLESAIQNLRLDMTADDLRGMVSISNPADTRILNITVTSLEPELAEQIANEMADLGITWLPKVMDSSAPNLAEEAIVPKNKVSPSISKNTVLGALVLAVLYVGILILKYVLNDTIRSAEEMEQYFGIIPLAVVPEEGSSSSRSKFRMFRTIRRKFLSGLTSRKKGV